MFDGSTPNNAETIAKHIIPTGEVYLKAGKLTPVQPDVMQVYTESEADNIKNNVPTSAINVFPYGFVVRSALTNSNRTLPASPGPDEYDGRVTFAFKILLQASPSKDPFKITMMFLPIQDSQTRITQSVQEQTPAGRAAFRARADELGATQLTLLGESIVRPGSNIRFLGSIPVNSAQTFAPIVTARDVIAAGVYHSLAIESNGTVIAWGGPSGMPDVPSGLNNVVAVATGQWHTLALKADGTIVIWGGNNYSETNRPTGLSHVVAIAAGATQSLALKADGTVVAWGKIYNDIKIVPAYVPSGLKDVVAIAAGADHSLALKSDGTVVAWGRNNDGQANVPSGLNNVVAIAAGALHSLALKSDGTVVAWGYDASGQTNVPLGLSDVVAIAAGTDHSLALKADGTVVAWGYDASGQTNVPAGLSNVVAIAAGQEHSLALKADGTVIAWGGNQLDQTNVPATLKARVDTDSRPGFTF